MGEGPGEERGSGPLPGRFGGWDVDRGLIMVVGGWFAKELLLHLLTGGCGIPWPGYTCVSTEGWDREERLLRNLVWFFNPGLTFV